MEAAIERTDILHAVELQQLGKDKDAGLRARNERNSGQSSSSEGRPGSVWRDTHSGCGLLDGFGRGGPSRALGDEDERLELGLGGDSSGTVSTEGDACSRWQACTYGGLGVHRGFESRGGRVERRRDTRRGGGRTDELAERGERGRACGTTGQLPRVPAAAVRVWTAARTVVVWAGVRGAGWQVGRRDGSQGGARCCVAPALALGRCQPWPSAARVRLGGRKSWPPSGGRAPAACRLSPIHPSSSGLLSHPQ